MTKAKEHAADRHMYAQTAEPQRCAIDQYIKLYQETGDADHFAAFLHHYEPAINHMATSVCRDNDCTAHFEDIKQVIAETLWRCAETFDPAAGVYFPTYCKPYLAETIRNYLRMSAGSFAIKSQWHFRMLQRANAIYYAALNAGKSDFAALWHTAHELNITPEKAHQLLIEGTAFRHPDSIEQTARYDPELQMIDRRSFTGCKALDPQQIYARRERWESVLTAFEQLTHKEQTILCDALGIACPYCGRTQPRKSYAEIAEQWELSSESAVEKIVKRAVGKVRRCMAD